MLAPPDLRQVHPLGKSPATTDAGITDDGVAIAESGAIIEYLATTYGGGRLLPPTGSPARLRCTYWLHYAEGSAMPPLLLKPVFRQMQPTTTPLFAKPIAKGIAHKVHASFIDPQLKLQLD